MPNHVQVHITFVHGTFAHHAAWAQPESAFARALRATLDAEDCELASHDWSGENSHQARIDSAKELESRLVLQKTKFPGHRHFVIAHSHGGNVLLYALQAMEDGGNLAGIITLGTPFISARPRDTAAAIKLLRLALPFGTIVITPVLFVVAAVTQLEIVGATIVATTCLTGAGLLWRYIGRFSQRNIPISQARVDRLLNIKLDRHLPLLCCTAIDDEAARWLTTIRLASNLPATGFKLLGLAFPILGLVFLPSALLCFVEYDHSSFARSISPFAFWGTLTLVVLVVILLLASILVPWLVRSHRFGFGGERLTDNLCSDIMATQTPVGWLCETLNISRYQQGLHHSSFFGDPKLPRELSDWILAKAKQ